MRLELVSPVLADGELRALFSSGGRGRAVGAVVRRPVALFGSYDWGDGEWMRKWADRMTEAGATVVNGEGLICQETPDDAMIEECKNLGKALAANA